MHLPKYINQKLLKYLNKIIFYKLLKIKIKKGVKNILN
jgi:hypothetical protein